MKLLFHYYWLAIIVSLAALYACKMGNAKPAPEQKAEAVDTPAVRFQLITTAVPAPVQLSVVPDTSNRVFITDHEGKIWIMKNDSLLPHPFLDIAATAAEKKKSMALKTINSIAIHPQFASNHKFLYAIMRLLLSGATRQRW